MAEQVTLQLLSNQCHENRLSKLCPLPVPFTFHFFFSRRFVNNFFSLNRKKGHLAYFQKKKNQRTFCRRWPGTARVCKVSSERRDAGDNHELDMAEEESAEGGGFGLDLQVIK